MEHLGEKEEKQNMSVTNDQSNIQLQEMNQIEDWMYLSNLLT